MRDPMLEPLSFISYLITLYTYIVIAGVIMSWLISFNVINLYNPVVRTIWDAINAVTRCCPSIKIRLPAACPPSFNRTVGLLQAIKYPIGKP